VFLGGSFVVSLWWMVYLRWFLEARFLVVKIFLFFEIYFLLFLFGLAVLVDDAEVFARAVGDDLGFSFGHGLVVD